MRTKTIVALLVPEQVPTIVTQWILSIVFQILSFWYQDQITEDMIHGGEETDPTMQGWKVIWIKWRMPLELPKMEPEKPENYDPFGVEGGGDEPTSGTTPAPE